MSPLTGSTGCDQDHTADESRPPPKLDNHGTSACQIVFEPALTSDAGVIRSNGLMVAGAHFEAHGQPEGTHGTVASIARSSFMEPLKIHPWRTLKAWNCLRASLSVVAGLTMMSPAVQAQSPGKCSSPITISPGDTLSSIARRCGTTLSALIDANPQLDNPNILPVGSMLRLSQDSRRDEDTPTEVVADTHVIAVEPAVLVPGGRVTITASSMPPGARVWIKGGNSRSPRHHLILRGARVDARGELSVRLRLPKWLKAADGGFTLSVEVPRAGMTLSSDPLEVDARYAAEENR